VGGLGYEDYLEFSIAETIAIHGEITELVRVTNADIPTKPKDLRR